MADTKNIQLVLKQEKDKTHLLSLKTLRGQARKFLIYWLIAAVLTGLAVGSYTAIQSKSSYKAKSVIEFSFEGIEKGLDPNGNTFDVTMLRSPLVVRNALTALGYEADAIAVDSICDAIVIQDVMPNDAVDKLTAYRSIFESGTVNINSVDTIVKNSTYFPTRYVISIRSGATSLKASEAVDVLNAVITAYKQYFYEAYGYNNALGVSIKALDYTEYDYERAIDVLDTSIQSAQKYVNHLAKEDATNFRSTETGYTFSDLYSAMSTIRNEDLDWITSYVTVNCVTKNKTELITYYQYRVNALTRSVDRDTSVMQGVEQAIASYEKDTVMMVSGDSEPVAMTQASKEYDNLIERRLELLEEISSYNQSIQYYNARIAALRSGSASTSKAQQEYTEQELEHIFQKVSNLLDLVEQTACEYYQNVAYANVFAVLSPASASITSRVSDFTSALVIPLIAAELLVFLCYALLVCLRTFLIDYKASSAGSKDSDPTAEQKS